jgi:putative aminopeptidase FrvX
MKALIEKLTNTFGPSGYEEAIRAVIRKEIKEFADDIRVDALGNLIARKNPSAGAADAKRVMVAAHMDEIGLMATHVDEKGFVRFTNVGGVFGRYAPSGRVRFANGAAGVINHELLSNPYETPPLDKMFIDVGATSQKDCPVKVGDVAAFERPFLDLGKRIAAKSLDDRSGVAVLIETMRRLGSGPNEVYFVFTTQEEVGVRGAGPAAYGIDPDVAIVVDVTSAGDTPMGRKMEVALGKGPAVKVKDAGMLSDPRVVSWMAKTAEKNKIPYQREILIAGSTDARAIQVTRAGIAAGAISIPTRYVHSPSEMVDMDDVENSVRLLAALLKSKVSL